MRTHFVLFTTNQWISHEAKKASFLLQFLGHRLKSSYYSFHHRFFKSVFFKMLKQVKVNGIVRFMGDKHLVSFKLLTNGSFLQASLQKRKLAEWWVCFYGNKVISPNLWWTQLINSWTILMWGGQKEKQTRNKTSKYYFRARSWNCKKCYNIHLNPRSHILTKKNLKIFELKLSGQKLKLLEFVNAAPYQMACFPREDNVSFTISETVR